MLTSHSIIWTLSQFPCFTNNGEQILLSLYVSVFSTFFKLQNLGFKNGHWNYEEVQTNIINNTGRARFGLQNSGI